MPALARRDFLVGLAAVVSCTGPPQARGGHGRTATGVPSGHPGLSGSVELWSWFDLPADDPRSRELSGIAWDAKQGVLWAVQDETPTIIQLVPDRDLHSWSFGVTITLDIGRPVDLEGVVVLPDGFIVCSEDGPRVIEVDRTGKLRREITVPPRFRDARTNKSFESLTISPSGRYLFTTTEAALVRDGETATTRAGTRVRIVRMQRDPSSGGYEETTEHVYETDAASEEGAEVGVSDLAALGDDELLVLERGWMKGHGNTARIYGTTLDRRASCIGVERLSPVIPKLSKVLRVDVGKLDAAGLPEPKQAQPSRLLENYEGIALGPRLRDGRATLIAVSDDNGHANQFARVLVLAI